MPVQRTTTKNKPLTASINYWRDTLRNQGIKVQAYAVAVAGLGCIGMIEERDATERKEWLAAGKKLGPWGRTWREVFEAEGRDGLLAWLHVLRETIHECPFQTARLRHQILDQFSTWDAHIPVDLAARLLIEYLSEEPATSFTSLFNFHWLELTILLESDREASSHEVREEFRYVLRHLADIQPGQKALLIQSTGAILLWELMNDLRKRGCEDCLTVQCTNAPEDLLALATLLCHDVREPQVRFIEVDEAPGDERFDWIIALPRFDYGRLNSPSWCPVQEHNLRGEQIILQRTMLSLVLGGHALVLMPRSFCTNRSVSAREWLLANYRLDAVIQLSSRAITASLGINTSLLCLRNLESSTQAWFVDDHLFDSRFAEPGLSGTDDPNQYVILAPVRHCMGIKVDALALSESLRVAGRKGFSLQKIADENRLLLGWLDFLRSDATSKPSQPDSQLLDGTGLVPIGTELPLYGPLNDELQRAVEDVKKAQLDIPFVALSEVATIIRGAHFTRDESWSIAAGSLNEAANHGIAAIGAVITAKELPEVFTARYPGPKAPTWMLDKAPTNTRSLAAKLQENDVLIARVGQKKFRIAVFADLSESLRKVIEGDGFVYASDQLFIIRPKGAVRAQLIASLLSSSAVQSRLKRKASSMANAYSLNHETLEEITIPLPEAGMERTLFELMCEADEGYALSEALHIIPNYRRGLHTVSECTALDLFEKVAEVKHLVITGQNFAKLDFDSRSKALTACAAAVRTWLSSPRRIDGVDASEEEHERRFEGWWRQLLPQIDDLIGLLETLHGPGKFAGLQAWLIRSGNLRWNLPYSEADDLAPILNTEMYDAICMAHHQALALIAALQSVAENECEPVMRNVQTVSSIAPTQIQVGEQTTLTAKLDNIGPLPLLSVQLSIARMSHAPVALNKDQSYELPFDFTATGGGTQAFTLRWSAKCLDGKAVSGECELTVQAVNDLGNGAPTDLGKNPYVDARTLQDSEDRVFFGREKELVRLHDELAKPSASTVLLIEGNRRTGKTSLLHHFVANELPANWIAAYCSFQSGEGEDGSAEHKARRGVPTREIFFTLAKAIVDAVVRAGVRVELEGLGVLEPTWKPREIFRRSTAMLYPFFQEGPAYTHLCIVLDQCLEAMAGRRLLLMIDEFDRLQEGIESGVTSDQVPENIRHLFQSYNQVAGILTGSRKIRRLREQYWNVLFGIGDPLILRGLEPKAVRDLITKPVENRLTYMPAAVEQLAWLTSGQPRILQTLCSRLFDLCIAEKKTLITEDMVERVAAEKARDYEHFKVLWSAVESAAHQFVALVIDRMVQRGDASITFDLIHDEAEASGVDLEGKVLEAALADLVDLEVVSERLHNSAKHYGIEIPLLAEWLRQNQDFDKVLHVALQLLNR